MLVLMQDGFIGSAIVLFALLGLVIAFGLLAFLFIRSSRQRREQEGHVRDRMLEMEREAHFAGAADRVPISRDPADVAREMSRLLGEYLSLPVFGIYAINASRTKLYDLLQSGKTQNSTASIAPYSLPATLLQDQSQPAIRSLSSLAGRESPGVAVTVDPTNGEIDLSGDAGPKNGQTELKPETESGRLVPGRNSDDVLVWPWKGPFEWAGVLVMSAFSSITAEALDPYREPLDRLTDRLAVALELQRDDATNNSSQLRAARTADFSRSLISCLEDSQPLEAVVREVTRLVSSDSAALWRVDESSGMVKMVAAHGLRSPEFLPLPIGQGLAGNVVKTREVHAIQDAPADPRCIFPREAQESGIVSYLGAPLTVNGTTLGVIEVHCASRRTWSDGDQRALESAASIISELVKTTDSRGNRLRVESAYLGLSESLQRLRSADELKEAVVEVLGHALGASRVVVVEFGDEGQSEPVKHEFRNSAVKSALGLTFGQQFFASVAAAAPEGQPVAISDSTERSLAGPESAADLEILSEIAAPIRVENKTSAVVYVHQCDRVKQWESDEIEFAERVSRQVALCLANISALEAVARDAQHSREELKKIIEANTEAPARIRELEQKLTRMEHALTQTRSLEEQARGLLAKASELEAKSRIESEALRRNEAEVRQNLERLQQEHKQAQDSSRQLLEINRLKSEFIVNAGREIESSLQSVLGLAELLERGSYGSLTTEQREAVHGVYSWARRIKSDVDWLVEYGSTRARRLESRSTA
ncbi:MAG TPA: GAF domain-containing protein [Blastocatellia bacterium]|nr:GAF domain-containing protein [Blastocatellia bacterium]